MEQSTILGYAKRHLETRIDKLETNLDRPTLSPFQQKQFEDRLEKLRREHGEICEMLRAEESRNDASAPTPTKKHIVLKEDILENDELVFKAHEPYPVHSNGRDSIDREFILSNQKEHCARTLFSLSDFEEVWQ